MTPRASSFLFSSSPFLWWVPLVFSVLVQEEEAEEAERPVFLEEFPRVWFF